MWKTNPIPILTNQRQNHRVTQIISKLNDHVTSPLPCPSWPSEAGHPLSPTVLPQLPLHPPGHLSSLSRLPRLGWDDANPRKQTLSLSSHDACAQQSPILADNNAQLTLQLGATSRPTEMLNLALRTGLDQAMEIFGAVSPSSCHQAHQLSKPLQPRHQSPRVARCCASELLI